MIDLNKRRIIFFFARSDMEIDEDSFVSIVGPKNDSIEEKIRKLRQKGDDLLESIDSNLKPNIGRDELQQAQNKKAMISSLTNDLDADETISDIKSGIILKRKLNLETDIAKMKVSMISRKVRDMIQSFRKFCSWQRNWTISSTGYRKSRSRWSARRGCSAK